MAGPSAYLIDPFTQSIKKVPVANNSDVFRLIGGTFLSRRTPDNNLVHFLRYPETVTHCFHIRDMPDMLVGPGIITGSRPYRSDPFSPVNFNDFDVLYHVLFLTQCPDTEGYVVTQPRLISWS